MCMLDETSISFVIIIEIKLGMTSFNFRRHECTLLSYKISNTIDMIMGIHNEVNAFWVFIETLEIFYIF